MYFMENKCEHTIFKSLESTIFSSHKGTVKSKGFVLIYGYTIIIHILLIQCEAEFRLATMAQRHVTFCERHVAVII